MFSIYDGREHFYQWDLDRKLIVYDETIKEVHFCNRTDECSLVCEVYTEGNLRLVNVPNVLLQDNWRINVYGYDENYTKHEKRYDVKSRSKPADYVYTETEVKSYDALAKRVTQLEENGVSEETISNVVNKYLEENPVETGATAEEKAQIEQNAADIKELQNKEVDLSNYYTKQETQNTITNRIAGYATETWVCDNIDSSLEGIATEEYVDNAISNIEFPKTDLSNYYTKGQTDTAISSAIGKIPEVDLTPYAKKADIPNVEGLASETYVDNAISNINFPETDLSNYYTKSETNTAINNAKQDLSPYAKKTELPTKTSQLNNDSKFITEDNTAEVINTALAQAKVSGEFDGDHGESAHEIALRKGFVGSEEEWLASLHAANPIVLNKNQYPTEAEAVAYMDSQGNNNAVYVWNNKLYAYASMEKETAGGGACLYGYRNSASSGIKLAEYGMLVIIPVSELTVPVNIDITGYSLSTSPHIYGGTSPTAFPTTLIANDSWGNYDPSPFKITDLKSCSYVAFCLNIVSPKKDITITVNNESVLLKAISTTSEIEGALVGGVEIINGFTDSGVEYAAVIDNGNQNSYLESRNTYVFPVPSGYCESKVTYNATATHYLNKYDFNTMTSMFTALATANPDYITETVLGKDTSNTYDIKQYVLDAKNTVSSGYSSAMKSNKPVFIITSGLHGVEPDAVHTVYHFMNDLCNNYMENEQLEYLRNNVKFIIVPISNPWGYVNQSYHNVNDVDLNKNFESGYRNNGTANTGTAAYSEKETQYLKSVFDTYSNAVFHLECHGKYGVDTAFSQTIWFSLMQSMGSELIELCSDTITKQIGRRLYKLGYATNKSVGGYITYYTLNGRPKDYTGTKYGILSATMEGTGCIYGEQGYSINTQKVNCEALENFVLRVMDALNSKVKV